MSGLHCHLRPRLHARQGEDQARDAVRDEQGSFLSPMRALTRKAPERVVMWLGEGNRWGERCLARRSIALTSDPSSLEDLMVSTSWGVITSDSDTGTDDEWLWAERLVDGEGLKGWVVKLPTSSSA